MFLPLSFVVGLFGINVGGMPWAEIPGHPMGFFIVAGVCAAIGLLVILLFRRLKWI